MTLLSASPTGLAASARHKTPRSGSPAPSEAASAAASSPSAHPVAGAAPRDIVAHLLATHHRSLGQRLPWIETLLVKSAARRGGQSGPWGASLGLFTEFAQELECGLMQERCTVFALVPGHGSDAASLRQATRAVQKSHVHTLKLLWALVEQVARAAQHAPLPEADRALAAEIGDLRDDYYQHLYEEECLLFPQLLVPPVNTATSCQEQSR
jgi:iron-sulfur cluster repair protein YtfE (RIC family)